MAVFSRTPALSYWRDLVKTSLFSPTLTNQQRAFGKVNLEDILGGTLVSLITYARERDAIRVHVVVRITCV